MIEMVNSFEHIIAQHTVCSCLFTGEMCVCAQLAMRTVLIKLSQCHAAVYTF